jgi:SAM-dependent methyltransferase
VGTALDAGCGTGADAVWLAEQGWQVTAADISPTVVGQAERFATEQAPEVAERISWVMADLTEWAPPDPFDLVVSQYVHPDIPFADFVARLAEFVAVGGTLLVAGHDHADTHSASHAPQDASVGVDDIVAVLSQDQWRIDVAETRTRQVSRDSGELTMHDLVVRAQRIAAS